MPHTHTRTHTHTHTHTHIHTRTHTHTHIAIRWQFVTCIHICILGKKSAVKRLSKRKCTKENSMINGTRCVLHSYIRHVSCLRLNILFVDDSNHDLELCGTEFCIISEFRQEKVQWIKCNKCSCWLHKYCCGLLENASPKKFFCDRHFNGC